MRFFLLSPSRMSQLKRTAVLSGDVLKDVATGQLFMLHPTEEDMQRGVWEYSPEADGGRWHYIVVEGVTYAVNGCFLDWESDIEEWCQEEMGQWPFGNRLSEEEVFDREVEDVLFSLESDNDSDVDVSSEDEGYNTSPEVDFDVFDFWALGLNSFLWRIDLYKEGRMGFGPCNCNGVILIYFSYDPPFNMTFVHLLFL